MSCERSAQIHAYHDDALAAPARLAMESHLTDCADCRELLADLHGLSNLIRSAPLAAMSPEAMDRLARSLRAARDRGVLRITSWLTAAAAAVLVGTLLLVPDRNGIPNPTVIANATANEPAWETAAVMPPLGADENVPEIIALATWMANDLSPNDLSSGERQ